MVTAIPAEWRIPDQSTIGINIAVMHQEPLPLDIDTHLPPYMAECRQRLEENLSVVARKGREKTLPDVSLEDGDLRIARLRKNTPESAEAFAKKAYALMQHVKITELLVEVGVRSRKGLLRTPSTDKHLIFIPSRATYFLR